MQVNCFSSKKNYHTVDGIRRFEEFAPMSDGIKLQTFFFLPEGEGPYNMVFLRAPYTKHHEKTCNQGMAFAKNGLAFAFQYCRGIGESEGEWTPFENERKDGIDAVRWLCDLPYVNNVGLYGLSYESYTQWMILDSLPDKVKTAYLMNFGVTRYAQMYSNGLFRHDIYTPWAKDNCGMESPLPYEKAVEAGLYRPHIEAPKEVWGVDIPWYREWTSQTDFNSSYWKESQWELLRQMPSKVRIPICLNCGWYDHHFDGMMTGYNSLSEVGRECCRLVIGPWIHTKEPAVDAHDVAGAFFDGEENVVAAIKWMKEILLYGSTDTKAIKVFPIGESEWREFTQWPPESNSETYFFASDRSLQKNIPQRSTIEYTYDPKNYILSFGAEDMCYAPAAARGSREQPEANYRPDVISFVSAPLERDVVIAGRPKIRLFVSSDAEDTSFIVRLMEVRKDGKAFNIRTSGTTLLYRNKAEKSLEYTPGSVVECCFDMWDILWHLKEGSCLRIDVCSSHYPEYNIHTNKKGLWSLQTETQTAHQTLWMDTEHPSSLILPVL